MSADRHRREAVQYDQFEAFADAYVAEHGREPSIRAAVAELGGSNTTISSHKQAWLTHRERLGGQQVDSGGLPPALLDAVHSAVTRSLEPVWVAMLHEQEKINDVNNLKLSEQHERYLEEVEAMQHAVDTHAQETQIIQDDYERLTSSLQQKTESLTVITDERNELAQTLAAVEARSDEKIATLNKESDELDTKCNELEETLFETNMKLQDANEQIVSLKVKLDTEQKRQASTASNYLKQLADHEARSSQERSQLETLVASHQRELDLVRSEHRESREHVSLSNKEIEHLNARIESLTTDLAISTHTIEQREQELKQVRRESAQSAGDFEQKLVDMEKRLLDKLTKQGKK